MDFGLSGRRAIVCGASQGLGFACASSLAREGVAITMVARSPGELDAAAERIRRQHGVEVEAVAADVATEDGRNRILTVRSDADILINNAGGPPPGNFRAWTRDDWMKALDANLLSAVFLIRALIDGMKARRFGRIVNITSVTVKKPLDQLGLSTSARLALTGFVATIAREGAASNVTINNILPGYFLTQRLRDTLNTWATSTNTSFDEVCAGRTSAVPAARFGDPAEFGDLCAFMCSASAGYLTAQNILLDGGLYEGTF